MRCDGVGACTFPTLLITNTVHGIRKHTGGLLLYRIRYNGTK